MPLFVLNIFLNLFQVYIVKVFCLLGYACSKSFYLLSLGLLQNSFSVCLLMVYRKAKDFCEFIFFIMPLCWNYWLFLEVFMWNSGDFLHISYISCINKDNLTFFSFSYPFNVLLFFSCLCISTILEGSGENGVHYFLYLMELSQVLTHLE